MCLAVLSSEYFPIDFLGEYIRIGFVEGKLRTQEAYDIVFRAPKNCQNLELYFLSPHNLIGKDGGIAASLVKTPGSPGINPEFSPFFSPALRSTCGYDARSGGIFWLESLIAIEGRAEPKRFNGTVLWEKPSLPDDLVTHAKGGAVDLMSTLGTLFCVKFPNIAPGEAYAMRIIVDAVELRHLPPPLSVATGVPGQPQTQWKQFATVMDPATCRFSFEKMLEVSNDEPFKTCKPIFDLILNTKAKYTLPTEHHRIAVLCPPDCDLDVEGSTGDCIAQGPSVITGTGEKPFMMAQWVSGRVAYPHGHQETSAAIILQWMIDWAQGQAKSKEDITTAVRGEHHNVSLLVDALEKQGVVDQRGGRGLYLPILSKNAASREAALNVIARDRELSANLRLLGYQVQYDLTYYYLTPEDRRRLEEEDKLRADERARGQMGYWLAWVGLVLAILSIALSVFLSYYPRPF